MTNEQAVNMLNAKLECLNLETSGTDFCNHTNCYDCSLSYEQGNIGEQKEALVMAIKALEKEPIIDKLIDEIIDTGAYEQEVNGNTEFLKGINYCLGVIDKYKAESKDEE